jgi:RimJ/RimL family protein N-acetyltransferase
VQIVKTFDLIKPHDVGNTFSDSLLISGEVGIMGIRAIPIGPWIERNLKLVEAISHARNQNLGGFFLTEQTSFSSTLQYLRDGAIVDPRRVLFLLQDINGQYWGQVGFKNLQPDDLELDAILKYSDAGHSMFEAISFLIKWVYSNYGVSSIYLRVRKDNSRAINLYKKLGFIASRDFIESSGLEGLYMIKTLV